MRDWRFNLEAAKDNPDCERKERDHGKEANEAPDKEGEDKL